ncbi:MAG: 2-hydroxyacid dehydrogenase [bacterium]|nr:2-hydroxyacid dehydrogenase [bacterium]
MINKSKISKFEKILFYGILREDLGIKYWTKINTLCKTKIFLSKEVTLSENSLQGVDCLLINQGMVVDKKIMGIASDLKYVGILATGFNRIDIKYASLKHISVFNVPGYATESVAEFVFGLILEHLRNLEKAKIVARKGDYSGNGFSAFEIKGKQFGIIGLGRIGCRVAEIAQGFGTNVSYWSRNRKKEMEKKGIRYESVDVLIPKCDFLSFHLSKTKDTEKILNNKRINAIRKGAVVINVAPMELIDLSALTNRLKKGDMTFIFDHPDEMEKKDVDSLAQYKNCIIYPPIGFVTKEARRIKQEIFVSNLENFLKGRPSNKVS